MSQQPQKNPGVSHVVVVEVVDVGSRHQNQPGVLQVEVVEEGGSVMVTVGDGPVTVVVVVGSLQPNHPGVLHVLVVDVVEGEVEPVVVVSSKHPHQPGVLQVDVVVVRVLVFVVVVAAGDVVISEPLLRKNFHNSQSTHSFSGRHGGTES